MSIDLVKGTESTALLQSEDDLSNIGTVQDSVDKPNTLLLYLKNPAILLAQAKKSITHEHLIILIVFLFVLSSAIAFAFISEEEAGILDIQAVSLDYPLIINTEESSKPVLEGICRVQDVPHDGYYEYPTTTAVYITIQGSQDQKNWVTLFQPWIIVADLEHETEETKEDFYLNDVPHHEYYRWLIGTNSLYPIGITFRYNYIWSLVEYEVLIAAIILAGVYVIIIFELMHRTIAALLGSFIALTFVSLVHGRPTLEAVINWIDFETVCLLFGMMIMVGIFSETGFFEWSAIKAYKISKGNIWYLTVILCLFTAIVSAFLDNVTTILLIVPVTIRLCKVLDVEPQPLIIALVVMSNIGGTSTAIGDPPNIIIVNDPQIVASGEVDFLTFSLHVAPGVILAAFFVMIVIYFLNRKTLLRKPISHKQKEIMIWENTLKHIHDETEEERRVREQLAQFIEGLKQEPDNKVELVDISELEQSYVIKNVPLLISSSIILSCVIIMFFLHSWIADWVDLSLAWIALIGAMIHLLVSGIDDIEMVLEKVELGTLLFFAGLFVLMHALDLLGLIDWIGDQVYSLIAKVPADSLGGDGRLLVAVLLILWVSALVSAFIDNIPYTTAMVPIIVSLWESDLGLPLTPLVWSLSYGTCFGGNGTLIGASANVVGVGLSEQQGYDISFVRFFKHGFPCMIVSVIVASVYLVCTHVFISWGY